MNPDFYNKYNKLLIRFYKGEVFFTENPEKYDIKQYNGEFNKIVNGLSFLMQEYEKVMGIAMVKDIVLGGFPNGDRYSEVQKLYNDVNMYIEKIGGI